MSRIKGMTREKAIEILRKRQRCCKVIAEYANETVKADELREIEAIGLALAALRGPTREMVERMFPGCPYCDMAKANSNIYNKALWVKEAETSKWTLAGKSLQYCPICGRPLTGEAVDIELRRWKEALDENT